MLLSLSPREKSRYKESLVNCCVGIVLIMTLHLIMSVATSFTTMITSGIVYNNMYESDSSEWEGNEEALAENFKALMDAIMKAKPSAVKGAYLKSITLTSTMGPGVKVSTAKF